MTSWRNTTLGELEIESAGVIQTGPFGSQLHASDYSTSGIPVVMPKNIRDLRISEEDIARVSLEHVERLARHKLQPGDIVYSRRGDVEKCALVTQGQSGWLCGTGCLLVRVGGPSVDPRFLAYFLSLPDTRAWVSSHAVGATMPNLNTELLREVPVSLPPLQHQLKIAATLGGLDDKISTNLRLIGLLEELGALHLAQELGVHINESPTFNSDLDLGDMLSVLETGSRPRGGAQSDLGGVVSLGAENVQSAGVSAQPRFKRVPQSFAQTMKRGWLVPGDILVYKDGGKPGNFIPHVSAFGYGFPVDEATINEHVYRTRAVEGVSQGLLYWVLRSEWMDREMRTRGTGVAIPGLNSSNFKSLPWPVLSALNVQRLNDKLDPMLQLMLRLGAENRRLAELRDTLLPSLF